MINQGKIENPKKYTCMQILLGCEIAQNDNPFVAIEISFHSSDAPYKLVVTMLVHKRK
jgi:hypothetical protein